MDVYAVAVDEMLPCPDCGQPFEHGEDFCERCGMRLRVDALLVDPRLGLIARTRRSRRMLVVAAAVATLAIGGAEAAFTSAIGAVDLSHRRDSISLTFIVAWVLGFAMSGLPGVTLHHYPSAAWIRQGRPRWWKGAAAAAAFALLIGVAGELVVRPTLLARAEGSWRFEPEALRAAIDIAIGAHYLCAALTILWFVIAPLLGPQLIVRFHRKELLKRWRS